ncbi:HSP70/90 co-chaperone [Dipsacomyces acuminosporus]|nr:HSP70/90 co-chaperone [Dipsacomyces acuminosporus]
MASDAENKGVAAPVGPQPATATRNMDSASIEKELNKIPLFMQHLPDSEEENVAIEALKSLAYDGPPEEIAENFKDQGNECFKAGKYAEAADFYTKGLEPEHDNRDLKVSLLTNRAAANLHLHNYGRVLRDCSEALRLKPETPKALFRSAKACLALAKFEEAVECCRWGLGMDSDNKDLLKLQKEVEATRAKHERKIEEREERRRKLEERREKVKRAVEIRNLKFDTTRKSKPKDGSDDEVDAEEGRRRTLHPWENDSDRQVSLDEESGHLQWPAFFLYPEFKESDFIEKFDEAVTLGDMLQEVLAEPPAWDSQQHPKYTIGNVDTYFLSRPVGGFDEDERLVKVGMGTRLGTALAHEKYVIRDGIPSFVVLPRGEKFTDQFIDRYRKLRLAREASRSVTK